MLADTVRLRCLPAEIAERASDLLNRTLVFLTPDLTETSAAIATLIQAQEVTSLNCRFFAFYDPKAVSQAKIYNL